MTDLSILKDPAIIEKFSALPRPQQVAYMWRMKWLAQAHQHQILPPDDWWAIWLLLAGRGAGKTRTAAEQLGWWAWSEPKTRWLVAAPTSSDVSSVCFEGESGLLNVIPADLISDYKSQKQELYLINGSMIKGIPASEPERFRGPQFHGGWFDELAAWDYLQEAWDMIQFGMRLGDRVRQIASTTPKPKELVKELIKREGKDVVITRASTYANLDNLAPQFKQQILQYEGTKLGRQEIYAEVINPEEDGIIKRSWLKVWPADKPLPEFEYIIMSLDTAFTEKTADKKGDPDPSACSVWGYFKHDKKPAILLLDCWEDHLGLPDLITRVKQEMNVQYGQGDMKPIIKPMVGPKSSYLVGRKPDLLLIEDKGSGISLRQMLAREEILAYPYNPGRADKLARLHMVSHIFAHGYVWVVESEKRPGQIKTWAEPLVSQLCSFTGEKSIKHDDLMDSATQAIRFLSDKNMLAVTVPKKDPTPKQPKKYTNPYAI
jgi:predicted phage terminase large subunit-like protein